MVRRRNLNTFDLTGKRFLFAIGSKFLPQAVKCASHSGAIVFARILPTVEGMLNALACDLPEGHLAALRPIEGDLIGEYESALCRKWQITDVVSRQSGGPTQIVWQKITRSQGLHLWLIARPKYNNYNHICKTYFELVDYSFNNINRFIKW